MAFTEQEKQIIVYGRANGKSRMEIEDAIAKLRSGITPKPKVEEVSPVIEKPLTERVSEDIRGAGERAQEAIAGEGEFAGQSVVRRGAQATAEAFGAVPKVVGEILPQPVRAGFERVGTVAGKAVNWLADKIGSTHIAQDFVTKYPTAAKALEEIAGTTSALGATSGTILAAGTVKPSVDIAKTGLVRTGEGALKTGDALMKGKEAIIKGGKNIVDDSLEKIYGKDVIAITKKLEKDYESIPLPKAVMRAEAEDGKSFAKFMAEKPHVSIETKNMKYDTWATAQKLRAEAKPEAQAVSELLSKRTERVPLETIEANAKELATKNLSGQEREAAARYIENEFAAFKRQYSDDIVEGANGESLLSLSTANKLKQDMWDRSPFNPTASRQDKLSSNIDYKIGQSFRKGIEDAIPDTDIKALNKELGDYYHAIEVLENLHGGAAPRGRIGIEFARVAGTVAGTPGGFVGSVAGYMAAGKVAEIMTNPSITTAMKRYLAQKLREERPTVADQVAEILRKQGEEQASRLLLPEPSYIPMGARTPPESSVRVIDVE